MNDFLSFSSPATALPKESYSPAILIFWRLVSGEHNFGKSSIYFVHVPKPAIGRLELHKKAIHSNNN